MINVQMFNILIAAFKLNTSIKRKTTQAVWEGEASFMVGVVHSLSSPVQGLPSKTGYTDTGQQTTKIKQETLRQKINRANTQQA